MSPGLSPARRAARRAAISEIGTIAVCVSASGPGGGACSGADAGSSGAGAGSSLAAPGSTSGGLGFDVMGPSSEGAFVRIYAVKNAKKPDPKLVLPFRGAAKAE